MPKLAERPADAVVEAWLRGAEGADGFANPAGPLYVGGSAAEAALTDASRAVFTHCSSCSGSTVYACC
ncbi:DUF6229 family protein [Kitasatospora sp. LaBMicrA B282]|uniref:DUF6229 family protein n=1 Tax=Kitasatospora sp. LaBMicrA B282 TaxID=3420949 RepID=UPI003D0F8A75